MGRSAHATLGSTHKGHGLAWAQQWRHAALPLARLELLPVLKEVRLRLRQQPCSAQQPDVAAVECLDHTGHDVELRQSSEGGRVGLPPDQSRRRRHVALDDKLDGGLRCCLLAHLLLRRGQGGGVA